MINVHRITSFGSDMNTRRLAVLVGLGVSFLHGAASAARSELLRMQRDIEPRVANGEFMGSVLVARAGKVLINKGYGKADLAWQIPNSPTTKFRLGSLTKQFTAAAILLLAERGKLNIDDPLKKYLADEPAAWEPITIFNLLTHTSGIPNLSSIPGRPDAALRPATPEQLLVVVRDRPLDFPPGTKWEYSNSGYDVLGYLIEKLSGETYAKFVQDNIFTPLGMKDSGYDSSTEIIRQHAVGYVHGADGLAVAPYVDMSTFYSAGALYSTTEDLLKWEEALFGGKVVSPASLARMITPFKNDYAFGLEVHAAANGDKIVSHTGQVSGFDACLMYVPAEKLTVIVLANLEGRAEYQIATDMLKIALHERVTMPITVSARTIDRVTGPYRFADGVLLTVRKRDAHIQTEGEGPKQDLYAESPWEFSSETNNLQIKFEHDREGRAAALILTVPGQQLRAQRITETEAKQIADAVADRIRNQTAFPGSKADVLRIISETEAGSPDYAQMDPLFAAFIRQQLTPIKAALKAWGEVKTISFKGVDATGADMYDVAFEKTNTLFVIRLTPYGKIATWGMQPKAQ